MSEEKHIIEVHLFDYLVLLVRHRGMIVRNVLITVVAVFLLSLILPQKYTAMTTLMPPADQDKWGMSGMLSDVAIPGLNIGNQTSSADLLVEMLNSRTVNERILSSRFLIKKDSLPLYKALGFSSIDLALLKIPQQVHFLLSKKGVITISAEMPTRQLAADVANAYVDALDKVNQEKAVSRARNSRVYIESQLAETHAKLKQATRNLADFQQSNQAVALEEQTKSAIDQAGEIKGQIIAKEVQLGIMRQSMKKANPVVERSEQELAELQRLYDHMQFGDAKKTKDYALPFADVPELGIQMAELLRDIKIQETVYSLLNQQYFTTKIDEARDTPTVQVLDPAVPPAFRSAPKRKMLVLVFGLLSLLLSILWILSYTYWQTLMGQPGTRVKMNKLTEELRKDITWLRRRS
jgi:tyrosine-protein kinase Etk/Wzc